MEIAKTYDSSLVEGKWYDYWMKNEFFKSTPDEREPYTIVIPPPNVTGILHLGHTLNTTVQDILIRRARMQGKNACWVPGTDHAAIATENKVIEMLEEKGIRKAELSREDFLSYAWEWKEKYGGIILNQFQKIGASCDWDRTNFTMNEDYYNQVVKVFVDLYKQGKIYKGVRMVNWDPKRQTALSDEEVFYKEVNSKLYHCAYKIEGSDETITIATTRPETILGDTAICVHPEDDRFKHLAGKRAIVPMIGRSIPFIQDEYVDMEFGTGALKITPAHDINDYNLGIKHNLETIEILDDAGHLNENAGIFIGEDRFKARKLVAARLEEDGQLIKIDEIQNKVSCSERSKAVIEPKLSTQWFCKMDDMADPALKKVLEEEIRFVPKNQENTYKHWMSNIKDWCISRQLWWGHRIPAFYYGNGVNDVVVAETIEEALSLAIEKSGNKDLKAEDLRQDEDVMDTWFSSWIWPQGVFNGIADPENEEFNYYFPTNVLVTGQDIIFFWVARMIMSGIGFNDSIPFKDVYFTGMVRDTKGRKMSKSLGNSPDLFKLIEKYSADGVRAGVLYSSPAGNDLLFDEKQCEQGRNFTSKIWNALRLVKGWEIQEGNNDDGAAKAIELFNAKLNQAIVELNDGLDKYRISDSFMTLYKLIWDEFCGFYLESVKPDFGAKINRETYNATIELFESVMKLLHPYMPFVTEEVYQLLDERAEGDSIVISEWPTAKDVDTTLINLGNDIQDVVTNVRNVRNEAGLGPKEAMDLKIQDACFDKYNSYAELITKLASLSSIESVPSQVESSKQFLVGTDEFYVPVEIDVNKEIEKLEKELERNKGFLIGVSKKLSNERFVNNAPEQVVAIEKKKQADAEDKIKAIEKSLVELKNI
jgi:valyl-tRNA synthetase